MPQSLSPIALLTMSIHYNLGFALLAGWSLRAEAIIYGSGTRKTTFGWDPK